MNVERTVCDCCGKEVSDICEEKGWIRIGEDGDTKMTEIYLSKGRADDNRALNKTERQHYFDFCNFKCLKNFIENGEEEN